jgi:nitrate reductase gamma subunit/NAD-dependent dihydropyrimidine dehydrogenase PreA subunit
MAALIETNLLPELRRFGATDISACFNCGVCTATCPLSVDGASFPRRMSRYAQLGQREKLLSSPELWSCYGCSECTEKCPTGADPAAFMAAARRYAVASYDRTHIAYLLATSKWFAAVFVSALVAVLAGFMYYVHGPADGSRLVFFEFVPEDTIHWMGVAVMAVMGVAALVGLVEMVRRVLRGPGSVPRKEAMGRVVPAAWETLAVESLAQKRFREDCGDAASPVYATDLGADPDARRPLVLRRWFLHFVTMWGFLGLLGATMLDYGLAFFNIVPTGTPEPIYYPIRLLGTLSGAALIYGTSVLIYRRTRKSDRASKNSTTSDWIFLSMLWLAGITGFALELGLYLPEAPAWGYPMFLVHVGVAMALVLLVPFGKFAHVLYRPVALFAIRLRG